MLHGMMQDSLARTGRPKMPDQPAYPSPRNAISTHALALVAIVGVTAWSSSLNLALSADNSAWLGRWAVAAETCQNNGYDMLIEPDHFEIWEQACDIKDWKISGEVATLTMQCFNEGTSSTKERLKLMVRGDTIERVGGYEFSPNTMNRCR
jgi:hypothetical protein